jgi:hypothetical protein
VGAACVSPAMRAMQGASRSILLVPFSLSEAPGATADCAATIAATPRPTVSAPSDGRYPRLRLMERLPLNNGVHVEDSPEITVQLQRQPASRRKHGQLVGDPK